MMMMILVMFQSPAVAVAIAQQKRNGVSHSNLSTIVSVVMMVFVIFSEPASSYGHCPAEEEWSFPL